MTTESNVNTLYKYRPAKRIAEYKILMGEFGVDDTLHLQDTTCLHSGPKCEIEVVKCKDCNAYQFAKALNANAEEYIGYHRKQKFWATKEDAYVEEMMQDVKSYYWSISCKEQNLIVAEEKLTNMKKMKVQYFTSKMAESRNLCYIGNEGNCRILGNILFDDGRVGYLTDGNYSSGYDGYEGDRIILIEDKKTGRLITENGKPVYVSEQDYKNLVGNNKMESLIKDIENIRKQIERYKLSIERLNAIIAQKDTLTVEQMKKMKSEI